MSDNLINSQDINTKTFNIEDVIHRLNSDLSVLVGYIQILKERSLSKEDKEIVEKLEAKCAKIVSFLKSLKN